jgi:hypothetical protein
MGGGDEGGLIQVLTRVRVCTPVLYVSVVQVCNEAYVFTWAGAYSFEA